MKKIFYILSFLTFITSCRENEWIENVMSTEQQAMIGSAVNFDVSIAEPFSTRITYVRNGSFNQGDLMVIYRQYEEGGKFDWQNEIFRAYDYKYQTAPGIDDIVLSRDWRICTDKEGNKIKRKKGDYAAVTGTIDKRTLTVADQTEADSLTWENGKTVRFRAWSRSNLANAITNKTNTYYYPDFCVSDWVTVSGPTHDIPMTLKHLGCRISFLYKGGDGNGNRLKKIEVATAPEDYMRDDNADSSQQDRADKFPETSTNGEMTAAEAAANVARAFNKMSMPAGVDIETGLLRAMTKSAYENNKSDLRNIEEWEYTEAGRANYVSFGDLSSSDIAEKVQRPVFAYSDNRYCIVTIPYDISREYGGEPITLPPYTRFKIWLYDVNGGDSNTDGLESSYHIFSLSDIKNGSTPMFPDGLNLLPGYSYEFKVGYRYKSMSITPGDSFSWEQQDAENWEGQSEEEQNTEYAARSYSWWKNAIKEAVDETKNNKSYNPVFHISSVEQFLEFIKLVNGDAAKPGVEHGEIYHLIKEYETITNADGTITKKPKTYGWSTVNNQNQPSWVDKSVLESQGYVFYEHYHPSEANKEAYSEEDYLRTPYSFYDEKLGRHFTVCLDCDLDFKDKKITGIGKESVTLTTGGTAMTAYFKGYFDGSTVETSGETSSTTIHVLKNLNVDDYYLFNYVSDAAIRNLKIETTHTIGLIKTAVPTMNSQTVVGWGCYIAGISVKANNKVSGVNAIAHTLSGPCYMVGCIHEGDASAPLVGEASNLKMYGCMRTASNISGAALLGQYLTSAAGYKANFFAPQISLSNQISTENFKKKPSWGAFMCNYYNKDKHEDSKNATAIGDIADDYSLLEYIRGTESRILRAVYDNKLDRDVPLSSFKSLQQIQEYYGLAPWKAMNYAIYRYNTDDSFKDHPCRVHYEVNETGYNHLYPQIVGGKPSEKWANTELAEWNVLNQNN